MRLRGVFAATAAGVVVVTAALALGAALRSGRAPVPAAAPSASADPRSAVQRCDERVSIGAIADAGALAWSPDSRRLAMQRSLPTAGPRLGAPRGAPHVWVLTLEGRVLVDLGPGAAPHWSASGRYLSSISVPSNDLAVVDASSGAVVARLPATSVVTGWEGERLLYWTGAALHAWSASAPDEVVASIDPSLAPDDAGRWPGFSADGERFTVARSDGDRLGSVTLWTTATGASREIASVPGWAPEGHRYALLATGGVDVVDEDGRVRRIPFSEPEVFRMWSPDARSIVLGPLRGSFFDDIDYEQVRVADGSGEDRGLTIPDLLRGTFSPDGAFYAGTRSADWHRGTWLEVFRCAAGAHAGSMAANWMGGSIEEGGYRATLHATENPEYASDVPGRYRLGDWGYACLLERVGDVAGEGKTYTGVGGALTSKAPAPEHSAAIGGRILSDTPLPADHVDLSCGVRDAAGAHGAMLRLSYVMDRGAARVSAATLSPWRGAER